MLDEAAPSSAAIFFILFFFLLLFVEGRHGAPTSLLLVNHVNWPKSRIIQKAI